jgi:hypothetical protein
MNDFDHTGLDRVDPSTHPRRDAASCRHIVTAKVQLADSERGLGDAVRAARAAGDSWAVIGAALDISRQAAQQRFGER